MRRTTSAALAAAATLAILTAPGTAAADAASEQRRCGYLGHTGHPSGQPLYNHCAANNNVMITVEHWFGEETRSCAAPGTHPIQQGNGRWRIHWAYSTGEPCPDPGYVGGGWGRSRSQATDAAGIG